MFSLFSLCQIIKHFAWLSSKSWKTDFQRCEQGKKMFSIEVDNHPDITYIRCEVSMSTMCLIRCYCSKVQIILRSITSLVASMQKPVNITFDFPFHLCSVLFLLFIWLSLYFCELCFLFKPLIGLLYLFCCFQSNIFTQKILICTFIRKNNVFTKKLPWAQNGSKIKEPLKVL